MSKQTLLYHGTLARLLPSIAREGLVPRVGEFTEKTYGKQSDRIVPAVFMATEKDLERVVHAMVAAIMGEVSEADFEKYDIGADYQLNDDLFFEYGAMLVIERTDAFAVTGKPKSGTVEPFQAESGDWYSVEPVSPVRAIRGDELRDFLADRGLIPSSINDFVDPDSMAVGTRRLPRPPFDP